MKIQTFWGYSENAVKIQICIAISAYLIVAIAKKKLQIDRNLYEILQILNVTILTKNTMKSILLEDTDIDIANDSQNQACLFGF